MLRLVRAEGNENYTADSAESLFPSAGTRNFFFLAPFCLPTGWSKLYGFSMA